jgi:hypothetical protein
VHDTAIAKYKKRNFDKTCYLFRAVDNKETQRKVYEEK